MGGGEYELDGTVAQPETSTMSGGEYALDGGVWGGGANPLVPGLFLPTITR